MHAGCLQLPSKIEQPHILSGAECRGASGRLLKHTTVLLVGFEILIRMAATSGGLGLVTAAHTERIAFMPGGIWPATDKLFGNTPNFC